MSTSYSSRHSRAFSPPLSTNGASTINPQIQRLHIVTRLAIEGKARKDESNVSIKMYLRLTVPADSVTPGSAIALFNEENVKILDSEVHPLDTNSVPYLFSSSTSPLLHNAARVLNLPARSQQSYLTVFGQRPASSSRFSSSSSPKDADIPRLEEKYTGHILVSGYQVSFVLPKEFPPRSRMNADDAEVRSRPNLNALVTPRHRRGSISDKNVIHFMAGISMIVPYVSTPPRAPYLLSIPTPSCLSNQLKLRIFPPNSLPSTSSSFQSLSSASDVTDPDSSPSWDMTADPYVTRTVGSRRSTNYQYQTFADDESSDSASAPGFSDGVGIQGTFPSTERIRVRWAMPVRGVDDGAQAQGGRRRVGVKSAKGEMTCAVLGRGREQDGEEREGVLMQLDYKGSCKGVWFPGVATLLGMDVALEAKNCEVAWARGYSQKWTVTGGTGFTGHEVLGGSRSPSGKDRQTSLDTAQTNASSEANPAGGRPLSIASTNSSSSQPSLLRGPLPTDTNIPDYSFEGGQNTPSESGMSSMLSRSRGSSLAADVAEDEEEDIPAPPAAPVTLHLNMNDLLPPNKNVFTFNMSGVVLVVPRSSSPHSRDNSNLGSSASSNDDRTHSRSHPNTPSRSQSHSQSTGPKEELAVSLPRFRVLASDSEHIETTVKNGLDIGIPDDVDVYASADPKAKKSELSKGGRTKISAEGGRVVLKAPPPQSAFAVGPPWSQFQQQHQQGQQAGAGDSTMTFDEYGIPIPTGVSSVHATPRMGMRSEPEGYNVEGSSTYQTPNRPQSRNRARADSDARMSVAMTGGSMMTDTWGPSSGLTSMMSTRPRRDGPLMIPTVKATVTPSIGSSSGSEGSYAVRFECPAPADEENEWLEFYLAQSAPNISARAKGKEKERDGSDTSTAPPSVKIVTASVDGVPVKVDMSAPTKLEDSLKSVMLPVVSESGGKQWVTRVMVRVGDISGGKVEVVYVVDGDSGGTEQGEGKQRAVGVALPMFILPVGWLQVDVESVPGFDIQSSFTSRHEQRTSQSRPHRFTKHSLPEYSHIPFYLHLTPSDQPILPFSFGSSSFHKFFRYLTYAIVLLLILNMNNDLRHLRRVVESYPGPGQRQGGAEWDAAAPTVTVTATMISRGEGYWWNAQPSSSAASTSPATSSAPTLPLDQPSTPEPTEPSIHVIDVTKPSLSPKPKAKPHKTKPQSRSSSNTDAHGQSTALLDPRNLPFSLSWPLRIPLEVPFTAQEAMDSVMDGLGVFWRFARRVYHWPLKPPEEEDEDEEEDDEE